MKKNEVLSNAFMWLFIGLLVCFAVSYISTFSTEIIYLVYGSLNGYGYWLFAIAEIIIAIIFSTRIRELSQTAAKIFYLLYAALTGLSLTGIFIVYTSSSLTFVFLATAILFGIFAIIGKTTNLDLSKWYVYLFVALLAIIILDIINIFLLNKTLNLFVCILAIVIFCAYIAYDVQKAIDPNFLADTNNKGIYIAFNLFLDFINIFIRLLSLFGKSRD